VDWKVQRALDSYRELVKTIDEFTEAEVLDALEFEARTRRRSTVIDRLVAKAVQHYQSSLKEKYHGT
jgi:hypothetical protein